jgi:hypothetical protein
MLYANILNLCYSREQTTLPISPTSDIHNNYYHGSTQGSITEFRPQANKFNLYGKDGIYLTPSKRSATQYASGLESEVSDPHIIKVAATPESTIDATLPLGKDHSKVTDAFKQAATNKGLSEVGLAVMHDNLENTNEKSTLSSVVNLGGLGVASFTKDALQLLGIDSIKHGGQLVVFNPDKAKIIGQHKLGTEPDDF